MRRLSLYLLVASVAAGVSTAHAEDSSADQLPFIGPTEEMAEGPAVAVESMPPVYVDETATDSEPVPDEAVDPAVDETATDVTDVVDTGEVTDPTDPVVDETATGETEVVDTGETTDPTDPAVVDDPGDGTVTTMEDPSGADDTGVVDVPPVDETVDGGSDGEVVDEVPGEVVDGGPGGEVVDGEAGGGGVVGGDDTVVDPTDVPVIIKADGDESSEPTDVRSDEGGPTVQDTQIYTMGGPLGPETGNAESAGPAGDATKDGLSSVGVDDARPGAANDSEPAGFPSPMDVLDSDHVDVKAAKAK